MNEKNEVVDTTVEADSVGPRRDEAASEGPLPIIVLATILAVAAAFYLAAW